MLIADEPAALDVTVQADPRMIQRLQKERGMAVIFITHDLGWSLKYVNESPSCMLGGSLNRVALQTFSDPNTPTPTVCSTAFPIWIESPLQNYPRLRAGPSP